MQSSTRTLVVVLLALVTIFVGGATAQCSTFCGSGRPCTPPCQSWGCSNCGESWNTGQSDGTNVQQSNSCRYAHDGECDEPRYCSYRTDCSDCGHCGGHRRLEDEDGGTDPMLPDHWEFIAMMENHGM